LFCAIAFPWYYAVQVRNPVFFREFILEHNLARFSHNLYHHTEPFWYYLPVMALALVPWTVFAIAACVQPVRDWLHRLKLPGAGQPEPEYQFDIFACCWLIVPVVFFSFSQSKLPGYILPAIPAGGLLLADYLRRHLSSSELQRASKTLIVSHALLGAAPIVPALLIAYLVSQHRLPGGQPMLAAVAIAFLLCSAIALTLVRQAGLRMLRFVTLIPVVLTVGAVLKLGAGAIDQTLSARSLAQEIAAIQTHALPIAVYHVRRELEYGLTFYCNHLTFNYDWGRVPPEEHLLVAPQNSQVEIAKLVPGRRVSYLGHYAAQNLDYYWISGTGAVSHVSSIKGGL
jgi:hypothetical protein